MTIGQGQGEQGRRGRIEREMGCNDGVDLWQKIVEWCGEHGVSGEKLWIVLVYKFQVSTDKPMRLSSRHTTYAKK